MNGSTGIQPTIELATNGNNGFAYPYPVMPMYGYGNGNNSGFFGGDGIWALVLLALLFGNNGFGGGWGGGNNVATTDFVSSEFTQRDISQLSNTTTTGFGNLSTQLCNCCADMNSNLANGFYNTANNICDLRSEVMENRYANQLAESLTQRDILLQTTQLQNQAGMNALTSQAQLDKCCCDLRAEGIENTQRILDAINTQSINALNQRIDDLARENVSLRDVISDRAQTDTILSRLQPTPIPAYVVSSPYQSILNPYGCGWNNGFNYGNGFYGNTIV